MRQDLYAEVTARMVDALEKGVVPWRKPWTTMGAHRNLVSGRDYRGINVFLTALSAMRGEYSYPLWVTMRQANQMGGRVRAGERGTMVVFRAWRFSRVTRSMSGAGKVMWPRDMRPLAWWSREGVVVTGHELGIASRRRRRRD